MRVVVIKSISHKSIALKAEEEIFQRDKSITVGGLRQYMVEMLGTSYKIVTENGTSFLVTQDVIQALLLKDFQYRGKIEYKREEIVGHFFAKDIIKILRKYNNILAQDISEKYGVLTEGSIRGIDFRLHIKENCYIVFSASGDSIVMPITEEVLNIENSENTFVIDYSHSICVLYSDINTVVNCILEEKETTTDYNIVRCNV